MTKDINDSLRRRGRGAVVVSIEDAARELEAKRRDDPPPAEARSGIPPGKWEPNWLGLPREPECPVVPIGIQGEVFHVLDSAGQFRSLTSSDFSHSGIQALFAETPNYPQWAWPRYGRAPKGEKPPIKSFEDDAVREALFLACARKGRFNPSDKLRGRGAWRARGGGLIYHAGERLWTFDQGRFVELATGLHEGYLYPRLDPIPDPWTAAVKHGDDPVRTLVQGFRRWNWERPDVDPILLLGWIGVAYLGGALDWRSAVFMVGDRETGKSTLQDVLKLLFGDTLFHAADTTAAGISQPLGHDTRPVALDELEGDADNRKTMEVVKLARAASSGAFKRRGGAAGDPVEYQMRSAFLFSAINTPPLMPQDLSRLAMLRLRKLPAGAVMDKPLTIDQETCGRMVLARLIREWHRFGETFAEYKRALAAGGHGGRGQDTYGTLLTCADLMLGSELAGELEVPLTEDLAFWTEKLNSLALPEVEDAAPNWRACVMHLLTVQVDVWRNGARQTVGQCLADMENGEKNWTQEGGYGRNEARRDLGLTGLGLWHASEIIAALAKQLGVSAAEAGQEIALTDDDGFLLAVPNQSPQVAKLFAGQVWSGSGGAGVWKDALRQGPTDIVLTDRRINRVRIAGVQQRCSLIVLKRFHDAPER